MERSGGKVSLAEAARRTGMKPAELRRAIREGRLEAEAGPGNSYRLDPEAVADLAKPSRSGQAAGVPEWAREIQRTLAELREAIERLQAIIESDRANRMEVEDRLLGVLERIERAGMARNGGSSATEDASRTRLVRTAYGWKPASSGV